MANQEQNPPQQEQPFVAAKQVGFNLEDIILNTNNEVALLYPEHNNKDHFKCVSDFISKCCLRKPFTRSPNMYKEYLAEFWYSAKALENSKVSFSTPTGGIYGEVGVNTFRNAIGVHYLPHSSEYGEVVPAKGTLKKSLLPPSLANGTNIDYASIFWEDIIIKLNKKHKEKVVPYTKFLSLLMMHKMKEGYGDGELTLYPTQVFRVNTFRNAIGVHYLPHSSEYVAPLSIDIVRPWFKIIGYGEAVPATWTLKKSLLPPGGGKKLYTRFLSLFMMHKMKKGYGDRELTLYPTQVFSVNNWALKPNQPEEPPFTNHMLAICAADTPVVFKAHKISSKAESVSQGTKPGVKPGHKKLSTSSKQPSAMDSNPSQPPVSTPVDTGMHKEDQQATGGPTSLGVSSKARANLQLSSDSIAEADPGLYAPSDFVPQQQGMNEGTKNTSYDQLSAGTDPPVLAYKTKSVSEGLETVLTQPTTGKGANSIARQVEEEEASNTIKLEDLAKLVSHVQPSFKDLDSPEDDPVIVVDNSDENEET
ncbi:hypothetical protein Tco_0285961 [Tanacetum coccineum]